MKNDFPELSAPADVQALDAEMLTLEQAQDKFSQIETDPRFYRYHPRSTLALGRNFDPRDVTDSKPVAIDAQGEWLDQGAPSSSIQAYYARNRRELNITVKRDLHIDMRYLTANAQGTYDFDSVSKFTSDSISVVLIATADFGREALKAGAALTEQAQTELAENPVGFARKYGTRYVSQQRRGAHLTALVTISALDRSTKTEFTSTFQGGGGIGSFSAKAKAVFNRMVESASKQSRLQIDVRAVGGNGPSDLAQVLTGFAANSSDPFGDMSVRLRAALAGFTKENSAVIEYTVSSMSNFGLDDTVLPPWHDNQEEQLHRLVEDYRNTLRDLAVIESYETGEGPYPRLFPDYMSSAIWGADTLEEARRAVEDYSEAVKQTHRACLAASSIEPCDFPAGRYANHRWKKNFLNEDLAERDIPPKVEFEVMVEVPDDDFPIVLDPLQSALILRLDPTVRLSAVQRSEPSAIGYYCWFKFGGRVDSYRWITELGDGTVYDRQGSGSGEMVIIFSQDGEGRNSRDGEEQRTIDWMASATGSHSVARKLKFVDQANRTFDVTFFEASWNADSGRVVSGQGRFLGTNADVILRF